MDSTSTVPASGTSGPLLPSDPLGALRREAEMLRARCSNLRHWCATLLGAPQAVGALDVVTIADLRDTAPEVSEAEGQTAVALLTRGGLLPPTHPLSFAVTDAAAARTAVASLTATHERLRRAFFALFDRVHPGDDLTDEFFLAQRGSGPMRPAAEVLAEIEREFGDAP